MGRYLGSRTEVRPDRAATAAIGFVALQYYTADAVPSCGGPSVCPISQEK